MTKTLQKSDVTRLEDDVHTPYTRSATGSVTTGSIIGKGFFSLGSPFLAPAILGFIAISFIVYGASQNSSPFTLKIPGSWFFGISPTGSPPPSQQSLLIGLVMVYGGMVLLMRVWYGIVKKLHNNHTVPMRKIVIIFALWVIPLLIVPPLFSRDVYSYAAQGEMVSHGISPYRYGPGILGAGPYVNPVDPLWINTPAPYGPLFLGTAGVIAKTTNHNELATVVELRLLELFGVVLVAVGLPTLMEGKNTSASMVFALAVLNPLVMLHLIAGAHNDAIMLGLLVVGLALAKRKHPIAGIVVCTLAAAIKIPAELGVVYIAWNYAGPNVSFKQRVPFGIKAGLISVGVMEVVGLMTGLGWGWVTSLTAPDAVVSWMAPATGVGMLGANLLHGIGISIPTHYILSFTRFGGLMLAGLICCVLLWFSDYLGSTKALGLSFLAVVVLAPVVQPWYLTWPVVILAAVSNERLRSLVVYFSIGASFIGLPGGKQLLDELIGANPLLIVLALLVLLFVFNIPLSLKGKRAKQANMSVTSGIA
ncbi:MAG: polyprenol phosphomannose-dependent alpha 1,6 mannosyltransferase MptB [Actinobacteria bacterium]|nr:polyprenol phosphomannose-dependent alpha 1,6 mannosyltransferase MptB [Actinomycetota bacterium]MCL6105015.1 polyprenol phosphomannose-dependent alpha 1,6 mannosyltransferase MptB [Actinomycetota bacterium]